MISRSRHRHEPNEVLQVVLDDMTVDRLREAAAAREIEVEQLIVHVIHLASWRVDEVLAALDLPGGPVDL